MATKNPKEIEVSLSENHLKRVAACDPSQALIELIWNGLDAGATSVEVRVVQNDMGGVSEVHIKDNGTGIAADALESAFGSLGESLKTSNTINSRGHRMHGNLGEGRFKSYSLGNQVQWVTKNNINSVTTITGKVDSIRKFAVSTIADSKISKGTHFTAFNGYGAEMKLATPEKLVERLSVVFAPKLLVETDVKISVNSVLLNPESRIDAQETVRLDGFDDSHVKTVLWKATKDKTQEVVWCDDGFNARSSEELDCFSGNSCSVFIASPEVSKAIAANTFDIRESTMLGQMKEKSIEVAQGFIARKTKEKIAKTIHELKERGVYPFEGDSKNDLDVLERNVFNVCATKVIESIPAIATGSKDRQKLTLHLLRTAIESSPTSVQHVFEKILKLPKDQIDELAEILNRVSIAGLIRLGRLIVDRRDFLLGLEQMLFDKENRKRLLERTQLHKVIESETWIFGEEYALGTSDETLASVLAHHHALLGHGVDEVTVEDGLKRELHKIPDLVLSRQYKYGSDDQYKHLIIELKRPSVKIGIDEKAQIEKYASAVSGDARFDKAKTRWIFVAISNEIKDEITDLFQSSDGRIDPGKNPNVEIYVKPWSVILQAAKGRMDFLWRHTEAQSSRGDGLSYLQKKYPDIMDELMDSQSSPGC